MNGKSISANLCFVAAVVMINWLGPAAMAQEPTTPPPPPCSADEHRQFDFWIGEWDVFTPNGALAGSNRIESILGGCVLEERWAGAGGSRGHSYNMFYKADGRWHQTWVDASGSRLDLSGKLVNDKMTLWGEMPGKDGGMVLHQITWHPLEGGNVRQHWQASRDGGTTWKDLFDGTYKPKRKSE